MIETAAQVILSCQKIMIPCDEINLLGIQYWCKEYETYNKYPVDIPTRFNIGTYQIHQGEAWKDGGVNKYESYCAAALHYIMVSARLNLPIEAHLTLDITEWEQVFIEHEALSILKLLSLCQQQIYYSTAKNKIKRASRYNEEKLCKALSYLSQKMIALAPKELRQPCIYKACEIMLGVL